jgi:N-acetylmuramoyl-L-alanine amidase
MMVLISVSANTFSARNIRLKTIVIDAGHGGHDPGCNGNKTKEKEVSLAVALKLSELIKRKYKDVKVILTRDDDTFVELHERAAIANRNNADCFISIHCNSGPKTIFGTESYAMGLHVNKASLNVANRENAVILKEDDYSENYDGFDPSSPEAYIILQMYKNAFLDQSLKLASLVEKEFKECDRSSRGVKQAGFLVLYKTQMPAILVETGFLTNPKEGKYMASEDGQDEIAHGIFQAFIKYKNDIDKQP